jgi:CopG family transcriptional regulator/antitoxin EndoAI
MNKRINIILPEETVSVLDRVTTKGNRSQFIDRAVRHYVKTQSRENPREQLKAGYRANANRDLELAAEWFQLEEEAWRRFETSHGRPCKKASARKRA